MCSLSQNRDRRTPMNIHTEILSIYPLKRKFILKTNIFQDFEREKMVRREQRYQQKKENDNKKTGKK